MTFYYTHKAFYISISLSTFQRALALSYISMDHIKGKKSQCFYSKSNSREVSFYRICTRERLLRLYNAISGKNYQNPEALEINALENAIYMGMKNDLSFLIDDRLSLYEHQSTVNPNMPLRLSDLYTVKTKEVQLELTAVLLNINRNHNRELMEACQDLKDYAEYVDRVRKYAREQPLSEAVECAITECIREGILKEFLEKNRAEVKKMSIYEYDQEKHIRMERQDAWEDGIKEGEVRGAEQQLSKIIKNMMKKGRSISQIAEELGETEDRIQELIGKYDLEG